MVKLVPHSPHAWRKHGMVLLLHWRPAGGHTSGSATGCQSCSTQLLTVDRILPVLQKGTLKSQWPRWAFNFNSIPNPLWFLFSQLTSGTVSRRSWQVLEIWTSKLMWSLTNPHYLSCCYYYYEVKFSHFWFCSMSYMSRRPQRDMISSPTTVSGVGSQMLPCHGLLLPF